MDAINDLLAPPFFDPVALRHELTGYWREYPDQWPKLRAIVLARLKELKALARRQSEEILVQTRCGRACASALTAFQDELIKVIYDFATHHVYRAQNPSLAERMALVATGGYGRGLLAPGSDIDLLFLLPYRQTAWGESVVETVLYFLWDLGFKVGHATRNVEQTIRAASEDLTIRTALLDARLIHGEPSLFEAMRGRLIGTIAGKSQREYIAAKLEERERRITRLGESRYRVEPNIKEGKGGLRDLNMLHWLAAHLNPHLRGEPVREIFTTAEFATYNRCENFLWTVRCHAHFLTRKPEERLSFDLQPEMARRMHYRTTAGAIAAERFMKNYFLIAKDVGDLTRIVCSSLELRQLKSVPTLSDLMGALPWGTRAKIAATTDFRVDNDRLNVKDPSVFKKDPVNLIRIFVEAGRNDLLLHPEAVRLMRHSLRLIDDQLRADKTANGLFLELLTARDGPDKALRAMNEAGVLGRFIPEFGSIVAMTQFNMYHHYTVDEHLIRCVGILSDIEKGKHNKELPIASEAIGNLQNRRALYVALLLHDAAKGRAEDHSVLGARFARSVGLRLGLSEGEAETAAWLVEHHLVMSQVAQSRDIADPKTLRDFASVVQSPERLKLLLLLTVADIRAVGPGTWTGWKGQLLRQLYLETEPLLGGGHQVTPQAARVRKAEETLRKALAESRPETTDEYVRRYPSDYWLKTSLEEQLRHAELVKAYESKAVPLAFEVRTDGFSSYTEVTLVTADHPRLLMLFAGACAAQGANIASAQIFTTRDGVAVDTLVLQRLYSDEEEIERGNKIVRLIIDVLGGARKVEGLQVGQTWPRARIGAFRVPPDVIIDNTASEAYTVVEVQALDRPGLLFDLTKALASLNLDIGSAHIATFGERAVDVFYVLGRSKAKIVAEEEKQRIREALIGAIEAKTPPAGVN